jgi:hypothetical protein
MKSRFVLPAAVFATAFAALVVLSGCGGNEPLSLVRKFSDTQALSLPIVQTSGNIFAVQAFDNTHDGFDFYTNAAWTGNPDVLAPGAGVVTLVDSTLNPGLQAVTIYHSPHLTSRVSKIVAVIREGDWVDTGSRIGTLPTYQAAYGTQGVRLSVFIDGGTTAVCPLSYLTRQAQIDFQNSFNVSFYPCK